MQQQRNTFLFLVLSGLIVIGGMMLNRYLFPPKNPDPNKIEPPVPVSGPEKPPDAATVASALQGLAAQPPGALGLGNTVQILAEVATATARWKEGERVAREKAAPPPAPVVEAAPEPPPHAPITLGNDSDFLKVILDARGAGARSITLRDFQQADDMGRPVWLDKAHTVKKPLELVPESKNTDEGSFLLYDAPATRDDHDRPWSRLGQKRWEVAEIVKGDDEAVRKVSFRTIMQDVILTKTYTLQKGDYHVGLDVKIERNPNVSKDKDVKFRYHLYGAHGLHIEAEPYTSTLRNAVIGRVDDAGHADRNLQDLRRISLKAGGDEVLREDKSFQYGGVAVQYFQSLVIVNEDHVEKKDKFLVRARPVIEATVVRGKVSSIADDERSFEVVAKDGVKYPVAWPDNARMLRRNEDKEAPPVRGTLVLGESISVVCRTNDHDRMVAREIYTGDLAYALLFDDITVDLVTDLIDVKPDAPVVHKYLLYNGPVKVRLLGYIEDKNAQVDAALVNRYENTLHLNTVTDYHDDWWGGQLFNSIGATWLVIQFTNLMHHVLWLLHTYVMPWSYGICILLLTVMVRGAMFPLSRRQAMMSVKMQQLQPEIKKLQEKHKGDQQGLGMAQMELYRKHGVSPIGSCWTIFLQLPIFMGLYYALQQSINFRLAPFLWIKSLAAPDMLFWWTEHIPFVSQPQDYGSFFYLGPYFNLLPIIVAGFMLVQQKMMTPPPTTEQEELNAKMMKFMSIFFALMFYKMAAGLCLYFIASSVWGFTERKLLPKKKRNPTDGIPPPAPPQNGFMQRAMERLGGMTGARQETQASVTTAPPVSAVSPATLTPPAGGGSSKRNKKNKRRQERNRRNAEAPVAATPPSVGAGEGDGVVTRLRVWWTGTRRKLHAWWTQLLRDARKR